MLHTTVNGWAHAVGGKPFPIKPASKVSLPSSHEITAMTATAMLHLVMGSTTLLLLLAAVPTEQLSPKPPHPVLPLPPPPRPRAKYLLVRLEDHDPFWGAPSPRRRRKLQGKGGRWIPARPPPIYGPGIPQENVRKRKRRQMH